MKDLINNVKNNTISEILAKKDLNAWNEIQKAEIKNKCLIPGQKKLLIFFNNLLDTILTENNSNSNNSNKNINSNNSNSNSNNNNNINNNNNNNNNNSNNNNLFKVANIMNIVWLIFDSHYF